MDKISCNTLIKIMYEMGSLNRHTEDHVGNMGKSGVKLDVVITLL
jgi:hypothetical protein